jgi:hypothetical protein
MAGEKELLNWKKVLQGLGSYAVRDENGAETFRLLRETETETDFFFWRKWKEKRNCVFWRNRHGSGISVSD